MEKLIDELHKKISQLDPTTDLASELRQCFSSDLPSMYPFNKFEYVISQLIASNNMTRLEYLDLRNNYLQRNKFLYVYEIRAPRIFGESWAQKHLAEVVPELKHPSVEFDPKYEGQYDFWYDGIRIELKASRVVRTNKNGLYVENALKSDSKYNFSMNFQQIKPDCCDVFVFLAVWLDKIRYWVLSSDEVRSNRYYSSKQHRGNKGEGQIRLRKNNIDEFAEFETNDQNVLKKIIEKGNK